MKINCSKKILTIESLKTVREKLTKEGKTMVFTNGCYDILHPGHVRLLYKARALGDYLVVAVNSDSSIKRLKGEGRPVLPLEARVELLVALEPVEGVITFEEDTPVQLIDKIRPEIYVKGRGYDRHEIPETKIVESYGGMVVIYQSLAQYSTTLIIDKIRSLPA